jgi:dGTP triphosphohydrolase
LNSLKSDVSPYKQQMIDSARQKGTPEETIALVLEAIDRVEKNLPSLSSDVEKGVVVELFAMKRLTEESVLNQKRRNMDMEELLHDRRKLSWENTQLIGDQSAFIAELSERLKAQNKVIFDLQAALLGQEKARLN